MGSTQGEVKCRLHSDPCLLDFWEGEKAGGLEWTNLDSVPGTAGYQSGKRLGALRRRPGLTPDTVIAALPWDHLEMLTEKERPLVKVTQLRGDETRARTQGSLLCLRQEGDASPVARAMESEPVPRRSQKPKQWDPS